MTKNILTVKDVVKMYGNYVALENANISVPEGSIYGLLGPNGAGKTTLMRIINQITGPDSGEIFFDNEKLNKNHIFKIGYMPEERGLYKKMKVGEQALYLAQLKGMRSHEAIEKLKFWFEKLNIINWWDKKVEELSKGMAQKIQFIVTVVHDPKLLIFDEPFSGFDPINAAIIRKEIINLSKEGKTIIFSTHRMESVEEICDYVALINKSKTVLEGPIQQIKNKFSNNTYLVQLEEPLLEENNLFNFLEKDSCFFQLSLKKGISAKDALNHINKKHNILSYKKEIPSMEEIFIKAIKNA
jgi:ABC-2 type transport system ATP-binding protein